MSACPGLRALVTVSSWPSSSESAVCISHWLSVGATVRAARAQGPGCAWQGAPVGGRGTPWPHRHPELEACPSLSFSSGGALVRRRPEGRAVEWGWRRLWQVAAQGGWGVLGGWHMRTGASGFNQLCGETFPLIAEVGNAPHFFAQHSPVSQALQLGQPGRLGPGVPLC